MSNLEVIPAELPLQWSFPEVIDNTCRSSFRKCETYWMYQTINRIKPASPSIHLHAGAAFAKGMEVTRKSFYELGLSADESLVSGINALITAYGDFEPPEGSNKTCEKMTSGLISYFDRYRLGEDFVEPYRVPSSASRGIEFSFSLPIEDEDGKPILHPETGNPILYAGRFDMLGTVVGDASLGLAKGTHLIVDEKTTSQLGQSWRAQWALDSQFTGYVWGARSQGLNIIGALIRGISFLKSGHGHEEVVIFRPEWQIERWHRELVRDVKRMLAVYHAGKSAVSQALDKGVCGNYGGCSFNLLCESPNPENWIPIHFAKNTWNPLERGD